MEFYFKKGKGYSKLLFVLSLLIFCVVLFTFRSNFKKIESSKITDIPKFSFLDQKKGYKSYNLSNDVTFDFNNRLLLFNVYNMKDLRYIFSLQIADFLKKNYENKVTIIDIMYTEETSIRDDVAINFILKNNIERPVFFLPKEKVIEIFETSDFPSSFLVSPKGEIINHYSLDKSEFSLMFNGIDSLLNKYQNIKNTPLKCLELEKNKKPSFLMNSLSRLYHITDFNTNNKDVLILLDSKGKKILVISLNGNIIYQIGTGENGMGDGKFEEASFCYPMGTYYYKDILYVADMCNNSIRKINFKTKEVSTVEFDSELRNPTDIVMFSEDKMFITALDSFSPYIYNINKNTLEPFYKEETEEKENILKAHRYKDKIYYFNQTKKQIVSIDKDGKKEVYLDLTKIKDINNKYDVESIGSFYIDDTGLYLSDKDNNRIFRFHDGQFHLYSGYLEKPKNDLQKIEYNQPMDIVTVRDRMYIADENNKRIVEINKNDKKASIITILPDLAGTRKIDEHISEEYFQNTEEMGYKEPVKIILNLREGWELTKRAPHLLRVFKEENGQAILIKDYTEKEILSNNLFLPKLENDTTYFLEGRFFYCNYKEKTPCLIKEYKKRLLVNDIDKDLLLLEFVYN